MVGQRTFNVEVAPNDTVHDLKLQIEYKAGPPASEQRLLFAGKDLEDGDRMLSDCGVVALTNIDLAIRARGGGGAKPGPTKQ
eukprot:267612-Heterocapsa_arctica.AAC.1